MNLPMVLLQQQCCLLRKLKFKRFSAASNEKAPRDVESLLLLIAAAREKISLGLKKYLFFCPPDESSVGSSAKDPK